MNSRDLECMCKDLVLKEVEKRCLEYQNEMFKQNELYITEGYYSELCDACKRDGGLCIIQQTYIKAMEGSGTNLAILADYFSKGRYGLKKSRREAMKYYQLAMESGHLNIVPIRHHLYELKTRHEKVVVRR